MISRKIYHHSIKILHKCTYKLAQLKARNLWILAWENLGLTYYLTEEKRSLLSWRFDGPQRRLGDSFSIQDLHLPDCHVYMHLNKKDNMEMLELPLTTTQLPTKHWKSHFTLHRTMSLSFLTSIILLLSLFLPCAHC